MSSQPQQRDSGGDAHVRMPWRCYVSLGSSPSRTGRGPYYLDRRGRQEGRPLYPGPARQAWRGRRPRPCLPLQGRARVRTAGAGRSPAQPHLILLGKWPLWSLVSAARSRTLVWALACRRLNVLHCTAAAGPIRNKKVQGKILRFRL
jgi:hypothetical protein